MPKSPRNAEKIRRVLVLPDTHVPFEDKRSLAAVEQVMADHKWDEIIQIGDFLDFNCISSHNDGKPGLVEGQTLAGDFAAANAILDRWQKIAPKAKITLLEGNHEERILRYLAKYPPLKGQIEVPVNLHLKDRGIRWVPSWSAGKLYNVGNAYFHHGLYTNDANQKKMVSRFGVNIYSGHTHSVQSYSLVQYGKNKTLMGQSLGCLCLPQSYMKNAPDNWQQCFASITVFPNDFFTPTVVPIFNHKFWFEGKVYQG